MQAELSAIESTEDGKNIVLGTVDGCLSVLAIADPAKPEMKEYLTALPSRDEEVCEPQFHSTIKTHI
jgi:cation transport ATPase